MRASSVNGDQHDRRSPTAFPIAKTRFVVGGRGVTLVLIGFAFTMRPSRSTF